MATPTLQAYEYQYKDTGIKLNGSVAVPFVDITKVTGLDLATVSASTADVDGAHGGSVYAKFLSFRSIVLDGNIYTNAATTDVYCDSLTTNFMPDDINYPFYFRGAGIAQRYVMCKSTGIKFDIDNLRSYGKSPVQITLAASDPRKYVDNADIIMTANTNYNITNNGNMNTYPLFTITGAWSSITLTDVTQNKSVILTDSRVAGDITVVDFLKRSVTVNGIRKSSIVTTNNWWDFPAVSNDQIKFTVTGTPTSVVVATKQAWG